MVWGPTKLVEQVFFTTLKICKWFQKYIFTYLEFGIFQGEGGHSFSYYDENAKFVLWWWQEKYRVFLINMWPGRSTHYALDLWKNLIPLYSKIWIKYQFMYTYTPPNFRVCARRKVPAPYFIYTKPQSRFFRYSFRATLYFYLMNAVVYVQCPQTRALKVKK